uniref:semaphorin-5A-like n=1 Tax=Myxine glutinosa TaxID=7769 RepID=UPI00358EE2AB
MAMMTMAIVLAILADMVVASTHRELACQRKEHPIMTHRELKPFICTFTSSNSGNFSQLVMDLQNDHLIVGGRNFLFKLNVLNLSLVQAVEWPSAQYNSCHNRGKTQEECQNYIRVLLPSNGKLFTCGTNAFAPACIIRSMQDISKELKHVSGVARCPYDPQHSSTALLTVRGEIYAATAMDFSGRDPAIYRSLGSLPPLRTAQYNSRWLHEPSFVSVYEMGSFVYVFLRERPLQHECALSSISRVARICTNDVGGRFVLEETWTTFMKASLHCRLQTNSGLVTLAYPELQATYLLSERGLVYAVFSTSHAHGSVASALCVYNMSSVSAAFSGPFLQQENLHSAWSTRPNHTPNFQCGTLGKKEGVNANLTERSLVEAQRLLLMRDAVRPVDGGPLLHQENTRFTGIAVDEVIGQGPIHHVVFITTDSGSILRVSTPAPLRPGSTCVVEEIHLSSPSLFEPVRSILLHPKQGVLFLGLDSAVLRVQLHRCNFYHTLRCLFSSLY